MTFVFTSLATAAVLADGAVGAVVTGKTVAVCGFIMGGA